MVIGRLLCLLGRHALNGLHPHRHPDGWYVMPVCARCRTVLAHDAVPKWLDGSGPLLGDAIDSASPRAR